MESPEHGMDSMEGLEERLQNANNAFESILALTPAPEYFGTQIADGKDPSEQWNRKKQTTEEKRAAKKAKLNPANQKTALDIMKENERKRKRERGIEDDEQEEEKPEANEGGKRQKGEEDEDTAESKRRAKAEKRKEKRHAKSEKIAEKKAKAEAKKSAKQDKDLAELKSEKKTEKKTKNPAAAVEEEVAADDDSDDNDEVEERSGELDGFDASGLADSDNEDMNDAASDASAPSTDAEESPAFDISANHSTASSASSTIPPSKPEAATNKKSQPASKKPKLNLGTVPSVPNETALKASDDVSGTSSPKIQLPNIDQAELQERLRTRIAALRAQRKADGGEGKPAQSRQELLDQRRKKEEQRKAAKKEQRRKQKEDEQRAQEAQLRGSGSPLSGDIFSTRSPAPQENSFSFSRLAFEDGTAADASMTGLNEARKTKGRSDPKTALLAAQKKQARIAGYDAEKRADIAEKDLWLNAKKHVHGERVRDDTSLLKKALKRKEKAKSKSESAWQERQDNVVKGKEIKQKKRDANLAKRREEKGGSKGGKKKGGAPKGGKKKSRPGFEGSFKA